MTRADKKELRQLARQAAAKEMAKLSRKPETLFPDATPEELVIIGREFSAVGDRIDWGQWAAKGEAAEPET